MQHVDCWQAVPHVAAFAIGMSSANGALPHPESSTAGRPAVSQALAAVHEGVGRGFGRRG
jgi:hypothetical protein